MPRTWFYSYWSAGLLAGGLHEGWHNSLGGVQKLWHPESQAGVDNGWDGRQGADGLCLAVYTCYRFLTDNTMTPF